MFLCCTCYTHSHFCFTIWHRGTTSETILYIMCSSSWAPLARGNSTRGKLLLEFVCSHFKSWCLPTERMEVFANTGGWECYASGYMEQKHSKVLQFFCRLMINFLGIVKDKFILGILITLCHQTIVDREVQYPTFMIWRFF